MGPGTRIGPRGARAAIFGTLALALAVAAHAAAGGPLPDPLTLVALGVPVACLSVVLARRQRGLLGIAACLGVAQVVLHQGLMLSSGAQACGSAGVGTITDPHTSGMHMAAGPVCAPMPVGAMHSTGVSTALMVAAHVLATLATAFLLTRGEALLARLVAWVAPRATPVASPSAIPAHEVVVTRPAPRAAQLVPVDAVSRRGPPRAWTSRAISFA